MILNVLQHSAFNLQLFSMQESSEFAKKKKIESIRDSQITNFKEIKSNLQIDSLLRSNSANFVNSCHEKKANNSLFKEVKLNKSTSMHDSKKTNQNCESLQFANRDSQIAPTFDQ